MHFKYRRCVVLKTKRMFLFPLFDGKTWRALSVRLGLVDSTNTRFHMYYVRFMCSYKIKKKNC